MTTPKLILLQTITAQGPLAAGAIARAMNLSQTTVANIIDRLEDKALVVRQRSGSSIDAAPWLTLGSIDLSD